MERDAEVSESGATDGNGPGDDNLPRLQFRDWPLCGLTGEFPNRYIVQRHQYRVEVNEKFGSKTVSLNWQAKRRTVSQAIAINIPNNTFFIHLGTSEFFFALSPFNLSSPNFLNWAYISGYLRITSSTSARRL